MEKKKVVHIITKLTLGGAQENTIFSYYHHDKTRYEIYLLAGPDASFCSKTYLEKLKSEKNVIIIKNMYTSINPIKDLKALVEIYIFLKKKKIDIIHTHSSKAGVLGRIAGRLAGVSAIVHTVHGWSYHDRMAKIKKKIYVFIERICAKFTDKMITVTHLDVEKGLREKIGLRPQYITIRSGIDFNRFNNVNQHKIHEFKNYYKDKKIIGTISRLSEQKNIFDFIKIARLLTNERTDLHFMIIGDGILRKKIEAYIAKNNMNRYITLLGVRTDINDLLRTFDVFVLTSLWEGLPRVIPEAMYCKVPVVANQVDGIAEIIENGINGFTTKPHNVEDACNKIKLLLDNDEQREKIIENAAKTIYPKYSAYHMIQQIEKTYEEILKFRNKI